MTSNSLVYGFQLSGDAAGKTVTLASEFDPSESYWIHLDYSAAESATWLAGRSDVDSIVPRTVV